MKYRKIVWPQYKGFHIKLISDKKFILDDGTICCCLVAELCLTLCDLEDYSLPGHSVCEISQARILGWVAISFSRGSSHLRKMGPSTSRYNRVTAFELPSQTWNIHKYREEDFPGGSVVKNLPATGHGFDPWSGNIPHALGQQSPCTTTTEPTCSTACMLQQDKPLQLEAQALH